MNLGLVLKYMEEKARWWSGMKRRGASSGHAVEVDGVEEGRDGWSEMTADSGREGKQILKFDSWAVIGG